MAQISRLRAAEISPGNDIDAGPLEDELDQLVNNDNSQDLRITDLESGNITITGNKTHSGENTFSNASNPIKTDKISERTAGSGTTIDGLIIKDAGITFTDAGELTIATGAVTSTGSYHTIDTESDGASDDLDTINGGVAGRELFIQAEHTDRTVVVKHNTGNIFNPAAADISLDDDKKIVHLIYSAALSKWVVTAGAEALPSQSGNSGKYLTTNGTVASWGTGPGLVLLSTASASNSATVDLETTINGTYDEYLIRGIDVVPQTDGTILWARVKDGAYQADASDYQIGGILLNSAAGSTTLAPVDAAQLALTRAVDNAAANSMNIHLRLYNPADTTTFTRMHANVLYYSNASSVFEETIQTATYMGAGAVTGVRFLMSSGNIVSGDFYLYGVKKS